jgi:hypothetical protein
MLLNSSKFSVFGTILFGFVASGAFIACSGVNDYPPAGQGGVQQQSEGGNTNASGGANNGNGGSNNGNGGSSNGNGGSNNGSGGSSNGNGGSSNGNGGSSNGSGGAAMGGASTGATLAQVQTIVNKNCGASGCHSAGATAPNLSTMGATLAGTLTSTTVSRCSNQKLANAGNASMSALVMVMTNKCGTLKMPLGCSTNPCIAQADVDTISSWINAGAKQ